MKVSVIIPAYNPGEYLKTALESVVAQTFTDWEAIVVDDGSEEDIQQHLPADDRIRLVRQENRGLSAARNRGIFHSEGQLIAFLDADDQWLPTKLEMQVQALGRGSETGLCHTAFHFIDENGQVTGEGFKGNSADYLDLLQGCGICVSTVTVQRALLYQCGLFDPSIYGVQDYDLWLKMGRATRFIKIEKVLAHYRTHAASMSRNYRRMHENHLEVLRRHDLLARYEGNQKALRAIRNGKRRARQIYGCQAFDHARVALRAGRWREFWQALAFAARLNPWFVARSLLLHPLATAARRRS
jgi:glycosyltransferase involved in cell wall biosynthesis